jgi:class 3 adenylate cyclase
MGCGASAQQEYTVTDLLTEAAHRVERDPSQLTGEDVCILRRIAKAGNQELTSDNASLVTETWERVIEMRGIKTLGNLILEELFRIQPLAEIVFHGVARERQGAAIGRMIDQVVRVETNSATLVPVLLSLGARHAGFGFDPDVLKDMQLAAMTVFNTLLGGLTDEEAAAWIRVWETVIQLMTHGMKSPVGVANKDKYEIQAWRQVRSLWHRIKLVQLEGPEDMRLFSRYMYRLIIEQRPEFRRFSNLTDFRTADRIMNLMTVVIETCAADGDCATMLLECGARHIAYETTIDDMMAFEKPFLDTCRAYLKDDFSIVDMHLLSRFWRYLVDGLAAGMTDTITKEAQRAPQTEALAIAFTDIEKSTKLWEANPAVMSTALDNHNRIVRTLIQQYNGYEVKTIGDSFMVAFDNMVDVTLFACAIQTELMIHAPIAPGFAMVKPTQGGGPKDMWNDTTLRVRVGVEWCTQISAQYDPVHRRFDYFGPSVNIAARVESHAGGGQVLMTGAAVDELRRCTHEKLYTAPADFLSLTPATTSNRPSINDSVVVALAAPAAELKGVAGPVDLYSVAPACLAQRAFNIAKQQENESGAVASSHLRASSRGLGRSNSASSSKIRSDRSPARTTVNAVE